MKPRDLSHEIAAAEAALEPTVQGITSQTFEALALARQIAGLLPLVEASLEWCERVHQCGKASQTRKELRALVEFEK